MDWGKHLIELGMMRQVSCGIQLDINAALKSGADGFFRHATLCDHNCTVVEGFYDCPAAFTLNSGIKATTLAPGKTLLRGLDVAVEAVKTARDRFLDEGFGNYCEKFRVPGDVARAIAAILTIQPVEINITGGNPELHPDIITILQALHSRQDIVTNLTTTGRHFMLDGRFCESVLHHPPEVLSLSADAFDSGEQVLELATQSAEHIHRLWQAAPKTHGQRQKALEAIYVAGQLKGRSKPDTGFNLVVHPGNINQVEKIIAALAGSFPGFHIFAYPAQTGFMDSPGLFGNSDVLESFIDRMIMAHFKKLLPITRRLQYWLMLKAVCNVHGDKAQHAADMIGGRNLWKCYAVPGTIRYVQIGKGDKKTVNAIGGGHLGCFWNRGTITFEDQLVWDMEMADVVDYIRFGAGRLAARSSNPCPGCGFPRLLFDVVSSEMGMNETIIPEYLALRKQYAGY